MTTEAEIVLMSLTNEELDDANRYLAHMLERWRESRRIAEAERIDRLTEIGYHGTDGPIHLIRAMDLALTRELAQRGGAEPWYAGMPLDDHPSAKYVRHYQERIGLNPDEGHRPRLDAAGVLEKVCIGCRLAKPLTVAFWPWLGSSLDDYCRACRSAYRSSIDADLAALEEPVPVLAPIAPVTPAELVEALEPDPLDAL